MVSDKNIVMLLVRNRSRGMSIVALKFISTAGCLWFLYCLLDAFCEKI